MTEHLHITPIGNDGMYILDTASWRVLRPVLDQEKCIRMKKGSMRFITTTAKAAASAQMSASRMP